MTTYKLVVIRTHDGYTGRLIEGASESIIYRDHRVVFKNKEEVLIAAAMLYPGKHFWIGDVELRDARTRQSTRNRAVRWTLIVLIYFYALLGTIFHWWPFE